MLIFEDGLFSLFLPMCKFIIDCVKDNFVGYNFLKKVIEEMMSAIYNLYVKLLENYIIYCCYKNACKLKWKISITHCNFIYLYLCVIYVDFCWFPLKI